MKDIQAINNFFSYVICRETLYIYMPPNASGGQCPSPENESYDIQSKESKLYVWIVCIQEKKEFIKKITTIKFPEDDRKIPFRKLGKKITLTKRITSIQLVNICPHHSYLMPQSLRQFHTSRLARQFSTASIYHQYSVYK